MAFSLHKDLATSEFAVELVFPPLAGETVECYGQWLKYRLYDL